MFESELNEDGLDDDDEINDDDEGDESVWYFWRYMDYWYKT